MTGNGFFKKREYGTQGAEFKVLFHGKRKLVWFAFLTVFFLSTLSLFSIIPYLKIRTQVLLAAVAIAIYSIVFLNMYKSIHEESLLVLTALGIQFTRTFLFGNRHSKFIEMDDIEDFIINEGVTTDQQVRCYLAVLQRSEENKNKMFPVFTNSDLPLSTLTGIYSTVQDKLFSHTSEREIT